MRLGVSWRGVQGGCWKSVSLFALLLSNGGTAWQDYGLLGQGGKRVEERALGK